MPPEILLFFSAIFIVLGIAFYLRDIIQNKKKAEQLIKIELENQARIKLAKELKAKEEQERILKQQKEAQIQRDKKLKQLHEEKVQQLKREQEIKFQRERERKKEFELQQEREKQIQRKQIITPQSIVNKQDNLPEVTNKISIFDIINNEQKKRNENQIEQENQKQQKLELIKKYDITGIYHMTHIDNLQTILKNGILSRNLAIKRNLHKNDIADPEVVIHGENKRVFNKVIFDYARFYLNPTNPMLFRRSNIQDSIVILEIDRNVMVDCEVVFSDGNASSRPTKFYNNLEELANIPWDVVKARYWTDFDDGKRKICAEVLIYPFVPVNSIKKIYCKTDETLKNVRNLLINSNITVEINKKYYF